MRFKFLLLCVLLWQVECATAQTTDVLGMHNLSSGSGSSVYQSVGNLGCNFCHAPHSNNTGGHALWNQAFSQETYTPYTSKSYHNVGNKQPPLGKSSSLCLSCHDGTVAPGAVVGTQGSIYHPQMTGTMASRAILGVNSASDLTTSHPFSLVMPMVDSPDIAASLVANKQTIDPLHAVRLIGGNVECTSCHNPHVQSIDTLSQNFLVRSNSDGQLCLACHDPTRTMTGQVNELTGWTASTHATQTNPIMSTANLGAYGTVATTACLSCHEPHQAAGAATLLRAAVPTQASDPATNDPTTQPCLTCHAGGSNLQVAAPNILSELSKTTGGGHPYPTGSTGSISSVHYSNETSSASAELLSNNRHATCVDCHNPHAAQSEGTAFAAAPGVRGPQIGVVGISATDGVTVVNPAVNQYENCLRCHGSGPGAQILSQYGYFPTRLVVASNPLNVIPEFSASASSSHPVMHARSSTLAQPSLWTYMKKTDGTTDTSRTLSGSISIFCTDCHNSDDNREFSATGTGPIGPHGSIYYHILERRYEFSQTTSPGQPITNLFPNPDLTSSGPYALCQKCHDLNSIMSNASFSNHSDHINTGISCSVCHTAHGMGATSATISGARLINFDAAVVAQNGSSPISYSSTVNANGTSSDSCTLLCHGYYHNADGTVTQTAEVQQRTIQGTRK